MRNKSVLEKIDIPADRAGRLVDFISGDAKGVRAVNKITYLAARDHLKRKVKNGKASD